MNSKVMRNLSYGLFVLTARDGAKDNGCIINTVTQVASEPNMISIAVNKANYTHDMIKKTGVFNVSILSEESTFWPFEHFGFQTGRDTNKFASIPISRAANGVTVFRGFCNGYLSGKVKYALDLGSHTLFVADVTDGDVFSDVPSATYAYYFANIKPKPQPAPQQTGWICTICGYIYEGDVLPDDFICPTCKHPASDFRKL